MNRIVVFSAALILILLAGVLSCRTLFVAPEEDAVFSGINDFLYQLQDADLTAIGRTKYDMVVIDYSQDGSEAGKWTSAQISDLKSAGDGRFVLCYLSIGEAESYRYYWDPLWTPGIPDWLGAENPDWEGNYKVKFWDEEWKAIIKGYLTTIVSQGFDGVYLDIIDAYEYWAYDAGAAGENESLDITDSADRMVLFVKEIAEYARSSLGKSSFIVCPQNGTAIIQDASLDRKSEYFDAIDAVGAEDVFFYGDQDMDNAYNPQSDVLADLAEFRSAGKVVLCIDYLSLSNSESIDRFYTEATDRGFIPFAADRELNTLRINTGHEPD